jgi:hypothetical protein
LEDKKKKKKKKEKKKDRERELGRGRRSGLKPVQLVATSDRVGSGEVESVTCSGPSEPPSPLWKQWQEFQLNIHRESPKTMHTKTQLYSKNVTPILMKSQPSLLR